MAALASTCNYDRTKAVKEFDDSKMGVKGLSDSGITTIPKFFIHPPETLSALKSSCKSKVEIPIIDLKDLYSNVDRPKIIEQVKTAARTWGFFQVINHGVPVDVLDKTILAVKKFHEQPHEVKSKYYKRDKGRGFMYSSNDDLFRSEAASWIDSFQVRMTPEPPKIEELPPICGEEVLAWHAHSKGVADAVMELLSEGLGLHAGRFKELTFADYGSIAGHYYPYCPQPDLTVGVTSHTDIASITVLLLNQLPGLQVKHDDGWVDVNPIHGGLIINVGDFLQVISNDEYKSVQHRVLANPAKEPRISVVEFFGVSEWGESGCHGPLPELLSHDKPAIYRDFNAQEFLDSFYTKGIDSKSLIEKVQIQN